MIKDMRRRGSLEKCEMSRGDLQSWVCKGVCFTASAIFLSASAPDTDGMHPDPRTQGVGLVTEHARWSEAQFEEQVKLHPKSSTAYLERGNAHFLDGDIEEALSDFNQSVKLDPRCARAYIGRYFVYCAQRQFPQAFAELKKVTEIGPADIATDALNLKATLHKEMHQWPEAYGDYTRVIKSNTFSKRRLSYVYSQRGIVNDRLGKNAAAIEDYTAAVKLDPNLGQAFIYRGNDYRDIRDLNRALADYGHIIGSVKEKTAVDRSAFSSAMRKAAYRERALLYSRFGRPDLAKADRLAEYRCDREDLDLVPFRSK